ncbi:porin [Chryseosolibacter indicus]|uniref:Porin n=1 Tax=Chryseosolibacter indicus TaxID=2782351 RepID=A0ABS5VLL9_9BACT|nr:porin [Chryseosolibacter indicus]MBT1701903.1 porin [Chryseosolibacter indicus]
MRLRHHAFLYALLFTAFAAHSQGSETYNSGVKVNLDPEGNKYVRFIIWNQIWMRSIQHNDGTAVNGVPSNNTWDIGARRLRFLAYAQITPRYLVLTHFGINNQSFATGGASGSSGTGGYGAGKKPGIFFHDVWNEYAIVPAVDPETKTPNKYNVYLGAGLHYWWGISRISSASTLNFLAIDAPVVNWPLVDLSDQFVRQFGVYTKGRLGKLNYNFSVNKPFATNLTPAVDPLKGRVAVDNNGDAKPAVQGYFDYQFLDQESNVLPYRVGTYVGTKKVFNIGAGFYHNNNGTRSLDAAGDLQRHNITLIGVDVFADMPIGSKEKNMAITAYGVYYNYDFGPNYIRHVGIMNPAAGFDPNYTGPRSVQGFGNNRPFVGTGNIIYAQAGLLLPKGISGKLRLQPFGAFTLKDFEYLDETGSYIDFGANIFLDGHHAKITPQYSIRPQYFTQNDRRVVDGNKGEFMIQLQVYL